MSEHPRILFVCLGNICRSPMAEGAMRAAAEKAGLDIEVDSAGTADYHVGEPPDPRAIACAKGHGVDISGLRGRQAQAEDFRRFSHIFALDHKNLANLERIRPADASAELALLLDRVPTREGQAVADPWYGDESSFEMTWRLVTEAADRLVEKFAK